MINLKWYLWRFKTLSTAEILFRINQRINNYLQYVNRNKICIENITSHGPILYSVLKSEPILTYEFFGFKYSIEDFNYEKISKEFDTFPKIPFYKIDIRSDKFGNAKLVWELNRFIFLPHKAILFRKTGDPLLLKEIINLLQYWDHQNPYLIGINWYSNIEVSIRLINWFLTWELLDADALTKSNSEFRDFCDKTWFPLIFKHCLYSYHNPSYFSSANNHLISEYAGLFIATSKWNFAGSEQWRSHAKNGLERELENQFSVAGVNKEEASGYIQFIADFYLICFVVAEKTKNRFSILSYKRLFAVFTYISNIIDIDGNHPRYGDDDDGRVFILYEDVDKNNYLSLLNSAVILFKEAKFKLTEQLDQKNKILFGEPGDLIFREVKRSKKQENFICIVSDGHGIIKESRLEMGEIFLHFDAAPLGYLAIAAHGHSDALSFVLHINGQEIFVDPGTFCYHTDRPWRKYFTSTEAHNTISIEDSDQAKFIGPTLWLNHYKSTMYPLVSDKDFFILKGSHNGYKDKFILHERSIEWKKGGEISLFDSIVCKKIVNSHGKIFFHFHPDIKVELVSGKAILFCKNEIVIQIILDKILNWEIQKGETEPIAGWYSNGFYQKTPCYRLVGKFEINKPIVTIKNIIRIEKLF